MDTLIPLLIISAIGLFLLLLGTYLERKDWNGGICKASGKPWKQFDTNSQGGRGYTDGELDSENYCWISYPWADRKRKN